MWVQNFRTLQNIQLDGLQPLSVFLGPNGSGKSTLLDVFAFLSECFSVGLRAAWEKRGRFRELQSRGISSEHVSIDIVYRESTISTRIFYRIIIGEKEYGPVVLRERLHWQMAGDENPINTISDYFNAHDNRFLLQFREGKGAVFIQSDSGYEGNRPIRANQETLASPDLLAVNSLGQLKEHPEIVSLRNFITGWHLSYLSVNNKFDSTITGPREHLSPNGDNLPNVIQYLKAQHPARLDEIVAKMKARIPALEDLVAKEMEDGRLLLKIKDAPFAEPILAKNASDGTLKMLAYLTLLYAPDPPPLIGLEEPENYLHPRLLQDFAEECLIASQQSQMMITTHSPFFVNALQPENVWVLDRDEHGFTVARRTADMPGVKELMAEGAQLGYLWMEGHFDLGDPLKRR